MKKADRDRFFALVDEMKSIIESNKILNRKDVYTIVNELVVLKLDVMALEKGVTWEDENGR